MDFPEGAERDELQSPSGFQRAGRPRPGQPLREARGRCRRWSSGGSPGIASCRSEEHTSELQSRLHLVCRLLLEKKKKKESRECSSSRKINRIMTQNRVTTK